MFLPGEKTGFSTACFVLAVIFLYAGFHLFHLRQLRFTWVDSASMEPTIMPGDALAQVRAADYRPGDIVSFLSPVDDALTTKRLVARGGDTVAVRGGRLLVNGREVPEPYLREPVMVYELAETAVPGGHFFLLGDNRNNSEDSSLWGPVDGERVEGRIFYRYRPWSRRGPVR